MLIKKLFCDETGNISITKIGASLVAVGIFIDGIPGAAAAKNITVTFPDWFRLVTFCLEHIGGAIAGIGVIDIAHKYLPKK